jgi:hypothetical protein
MPAPLLLVSAGVEAPASWISSPPPTTPSRLQRARHGLNGRPTGLDVDERVSWVTAKLAELGAVAYSPALVLPLGSCLGADCADHVDSGRRRPPECCGY